MDLSEMAEELFGGARATSFPDTSMFAALKNARLQVELARQVLATAVEEANEHLEQSPVVQLVGESLVRRAQRRGDPRIFVDDDGSLVLELRYGKPEKGPKPKKTKPKAKKTRKPKKTVPPKKPEAPELEDDTSGLGSLTALATKQGLDPDTYKVRRSSGRKRVKTGDPVPVSLVTDEDLGANSAPTDPVDESDIENLLADF